MGYSFDSRVRFSESGTDGRLTLPGILDYFQDCCNFQVDSIHQGFRELLKRNRIWVLNSWQVIVHRYPEEGEFIRTTTLPYKLSMCFGYRNFTMEGKEGELLAVANSLWTNLDTGTGRPARLTDEDLRGYVMDEKLEMPYAGRKIVLPENARKGEPFTVQRYHMDINQHVNNCQYVRLAMEYKPEGTEVARMRAEYHKQAFLGDVFCPEIYKENDRIVVAFRNEDGDLYASVELIIQHIEKEEKDYA